MDAAPSFIPLLSQFLTLINLVDILPNLFHLATWPILMLAASWVDEGQVTAIVYT